MGHLFQRRCDQAGQADDVGILLLGGVEDGLGVHHHPQVDDFEIIALEHHTDDVLADVVHVALDRGHDDLAGGAGISGLLRFDIGNQIGHRLFHHPRRLHHLGQEHLAVAEQVAHHVHTVHQRPLDHLNRAGELLARLLGVLGDVGVDALDQGMFQALGHRPLTPRQILLLLLAAPALIFAGNGHQALGGVGTAVEDHVFHAVAQFHGQFVVHRQLAGVDDTHVHTGVHRVVEEYRMDGLAHRIVAAEGERHVAHPPGDQGMRQGALDLAGGLDEVHRVIVVLFDAGGDGEDIGIENEVFRGEPHLFG